MESYGGLGGGARYRQAAARDGTGAQSVRKRRRHGLRRLMDAAHMASPMRLLLEAHAANVCARHLRRMGPRGTLAVRAFKRAPVEMHHADVSIEAVEKRKLSSALSTAVASLLQMNGSVMLVHVSLLPETAPTNETRVGLARVARASMRHHRGRRRPERAFRARRHLFHRRRRRRALRGSHHRRRADDQRRRQSARKCHRQLRRQHRRRDRARQRRIGTLRNGGRLAQRVCARSGRLLVHQKINRMLPRTPRRPE